MSRVERGRGNEPRPLGFAGCSAKRAAEAYHAMGTAPQTSPEPSLSREKRGASSRVCREPQLVWQSGQIGTRTQIRSAQSEGWLHAKSRLPNLFSMRFRERFAQTSPSKS